jgi:hypothetical protein
MAMGEDPNDRPIQNLLRLAIEAEQSVITDRAEGTMNAEAELLTRLAKVSARARELRKLRPGFPVRADVAADLFEELAECLAFLVRLY